MPSEEEMVDIFMPADQNTGTSSQTDDEGNTATAEEHEVRINEPCVVIWDVNDHREWYIGMCVSDNVEMTVMSLNTLERYRSHLDYKEKEHRLWRYPEKTRHTDCDQCTTDSLHCSWLLESCQKSNDISIGKLAND